VAHHRPEGRPYRRCIKPVLLELDVMKLLLLSQLHNLIACAPYIIVSVIAAKAVEIAAYSKTSV
jgi:hypothetical protein